MELKAIKGGDIHDAVEFLDFHRPENGEYPEDTDYYLKSEADKVIAELEEKHLRDLQDAEDSFKSVLELNRKELRRHKFKRSHDEAKICQLRLERYEQYVTKYKDCNDPSIQRWKFLKDHYEKWYMRWLKIADQFNPNSTATKENNNG